MNRLFDSTNNSSKLGNKYLEKKLVVGLDNQIKLFNSFIDLKSNSFKGDLLMQLVQ